MASPLGKRLGQNIVVEAIAGANTISGTQQLVRATPDGYTFMITTMSTTVNNRFMIANLSYDPDKDLAPITQLSHGTVLFSGPGNAPYNDLKGFIAWAKSRDRVTYGSWGIASWGHLAGQILKREAGLNLEHVPYKGDVLAITDVQLAADVLRPVWEEANGADGFVSFEVAPSPSGPTSCEPGISTSVNEIAPDWLPRSPRASQSDGCASQCSLSTTKTERSS